MNVEELLNVAEAAILKCTDRTQFRYKLIIRKGELLCVPARNCAPDDIFIYALSRFHLEHGLGPCEWDKLGTKLFTIYQELKL